MSVADNIRHKAEQKKRERTPEESLRDTFNEASTGLIKQFMQNVMSGHIQIEDTADLSRLFAIYMQINNIHAIESGTSGAIPEISIGQQSVFKEKLDVETETVNGETEDYIDLDDLAELSDEDVSEMMLKRELELNKENEVSF